MKLEAKRRLTAIRSVGPIPQSMLLMKQSVRQYFVDIANKTAGLTPLTGDCRSYVAKALRDHEHQQAEVVVVGLAPDHALHAFTTNREGGTQADVYKNHEYDPETGVYTRIRDGKPEELDTLWKMPVHEFMVAWVQPRKDRPGTDARIDAYIKAHSRNPK